MAPESTGATSTARGIRAASEKRILLLVAVTVERDGEFIWRILAYLEPSYTSALDGHRGPRSIHFTIVTSISEQARKDTSRSSSVDLGLVGRKKRFQVQIRRDGCEMLCVELLLLSIAVDVLQFQRSDV